MISMVVAISENNCIGKEGTLPWHIPEDLKHFKEKTMGKVMIMGRKTWESIPEKFRPLPGRTNVVITRSIDYTVPEGVHVQTSLESALAAFAHKDIAIIGGGQVYALGISHADILEVTHVHQHVDGDAFFPEIDPTVWEKQKEDKREGYTFVTYKKR